MTMTFLRKAFATLNVSPNGRYVVSERLLLTPRDASRIAAPFTSSHITPSASPQTSPFSTSALLRGPKAKPPPAPAIAKATTHLDKQLIQVETDPEILAKFCCINYQADKTEGGPGPELKEDDFYPDWLWELEKTIVPYFELDPKTDEYWARRKKAYCYHQAELKRKMHQKLKE